MTLDQSPDRPRTSLQNAMGLVILLAGLFVVLGSLISLVLGYEDLPRVGLLTALAALLLGLGVALQLMDASRRFKSTTTKLHDELLKTIEMLRQDAAKAELETSAMQDPSVDQQIQELQRQIDDLKSSTPGVQGALGGRGGRRDRDGHCHAHDCYLTTSPPAEGNAKRSLVRRLISLLPRTTVQGSVRLRLDPPRR